MTELTITVRIEDRLYDFIEDRMPELERQVSRALTKIIASEVRQGMSMDFATRDITPGRRLG